VGTKNPSPPKTSVLQNLIRDPRHGRFLLNCLLDRSVPGFGPVANPCEHCNELTDFMKGGLFRD
jgi:hypothetical protein